MALIDETSLALVSLLRPFLDFDMNSQRLKVAYEAFGMNSRKLQKCNLPIDIEKGYQFMQSCQLRGFRSFKSYSSLLKPSVADRHLPRKFH
jgi:hypothetical protein